MPQVATCYTKKEVKEFRAGIAVYHREQEVIRRVIRLKGNALHQDDFDRLFNMIKRTKAPKGSKWKWIDRIRGHHRVPFFVGLTENTYMLGTMYGGLREQYLDLLQHMIRCGDIAVEGKTPNLVYSLP